jgi:hypothetical protein
VSELNSREIAFDTAQDGGLIFIFTWGLGQSPESIIVVGTEAKITVD